MTETPDPMSRPKESGPGTAEPSPLLILAVTGTWTVSLMSYYAQSQLLGPVMAEFGRGEQAIGWLFSIENAALALSTLAAAGPLARISRIKTAFVGGLLVVVANVASALVANTGGDYELLLVARVLLGVGAGITGAAGTASAASGRDPQRIFAVVTVSWGLLGAGEPTLLAYAIEPFGATGGFLMLGGMGLLCMPMFIWLLPARATTAPRPSLTGAPNRWLALVAMGGLLIFETGQGGVYTFIAQIGERSGLDGYQVGNALSGTALAGLIGGVIAAGLGGRFGRNGPIAIGITLNVVAAVGIALGDDAASYIALNFLWNAAYYFVVPYLMGALAAMDDLGRWVVASDGAWTLGDALGPGIAGSLVERWGYTPLAWLALIAGVTCLIAILNVLRRFDSQQAARS
jgi:predicted MFS family arabinose efflux permease